MAPALVDLGKDQLRPSLPGSAQPHRDLFQPREAEAAALDYAHAVAAKLDLAVTTGKGMVEVIRSGANKGEALRAFMIEAPFAGALPDLMPAGRSRRAPRS